MDHAQPPHLEFAIASRPVLTVTAAQSVAIGHDCIAEHAHCVLIGPGLRSDRPYQVKIGNAEVSVSREMTPGEFQALYATLVDAVTAEHMAGSIRGRAADPDQPATYVMQTPHGVIGWPIWR